MELVKGVYLHFIQSDKFKTNRIKMRFSSQMSRKTIAGRSLSASVLETANKKYPTVQMFRKKLASLYGADFSTNVSRCGFIHYVDINISFIRDKFLNRKNHLTVDILEFLRVSIFSPKVENGAFDLTIFDIEKNNILRDLGSAFENPFYRAHQELNQIFYVDENIAIPQTGRIDLVREETAESSFICFQKMINEDQIDLFFLGDFKSQVIRKIFLEFGLPPREMCFFFHYHQEFSSVLREKFEKRENHQSILEMGYHFPIKYGESEHFPLIVFNGLLGSFSHSKLFVNLREKEGLAYTVASQCDIFSGLLRVYAGVNRKNCNKTISMIKKQFLGLKFGDFSEEELEQTKRLLKNAALLAQDQPNTLIERAHLERVFGKRFLTLECWLANLEKVKKQDVMKVAHRLKLQAIYFMEGK